MKPVVIIHIPKTAGTSLRKIIKNNYASDELFFVYDKHPDFHSISDLKNINSRVLEKYKIIMGHIPFNKNLLSTENFRFFTIMRKPVERVISYYHHIMSHNDEWRGRITSLLEYLETSGDLQLQNQQTRMLSGMKGHPITDKHLEQAIKNIDLYFEHVGISENFTESIDYLHNLLGWKNTAILYENVSVNRPAVTSYSVYELNRIREVNQFDISLYEHVRSKS